MVETDPDIVGGARGQRPQQDVRRHAAHHEDCAKDVEGLERNHPTSIAL